MHLLSKWFLLSNFRENPPMLPHPAGNKPQTSGFGQTQNTYYIKVRENESEKCVAKQKYRKIPAGKINDMVTKYLLTIT